MCQCSKGKAKSGVLRREVTSPALPLKLGRSPGWGRGWEAARGPANLGSQGLTATQGCFPFPTCLFPIIILISLGPRLCNKSLECVRCSHTSKHQPRLVARNLSPSDYVTSGKYLPPLGSESWQLCTALPSSLTRGL